MTNALTIIKNMVIVAIRLIALQINNAIVMEIVLFLVTCLIARVGKVIWGSIAINVHLFLIATPPVLKERIFWADMRRV